MYVTLFLDLAHSMLNCSTASATEVALRNARDTQLEKLEDESAHKHSSESIFKTAHDRLTELLREAKVR